MANPSTNSLVRRQCRYTVSRLLELAPQARPINFDLSKFTYDAARAGVVPPLGACAMPNRRTSSDRPRGWSQESGSSQEEVIVYQGNRVMKAPDRQPTVPPTSPRAQKDDGFAKFLRKHSSPTHQRVTTGGRIVPMEQQPRPPVFSMPRTTQPLEDHKNIANDGVDSVTKPYVAGQDQAKRGVADGINNYNLHSQSQSHLPTGNGTVDASTFTLGANVNAVNGINADAFDATRMPLSYSQAMSPLPFYAGLHGDPYSMMMMQSHMYAGTSLPVTSFNSAVDSNFATSFIPSPQMLGPSSSCGITTTPTDPLIQACYGEKILKDTIEQFHILDEQLKGLDRHRAMHELDPYLASQRMAIVQLRADAKESITHWSEKLGYDLQGIFKRTTGLANSKLNVRATSYVPLRAHHSGETLSDESGSGLKVNDAGQKNVKPDFVVDSTRRPIPIVPPPGKSPSPQKNGNVDAGSKFEAVEVDEWGVRVGPAPPDIQHHQNEMLKELVHQASMSPLNSSDNAVTFTPQGSHVVSPLVQQYESKAFKTTTDTGFESEWLPTNPGRAPPTVEDCYEVQLDAMRLPPGTVTKVRMPDGTITEVRGCGLKRPRSFEADEFLHRYWTAKPTLTKEMFDNFIEIRRDGVDEEPVSIADYLDMEALSLNSTIFQTKIAPEGLSSRNSDGSDKYSNESLNAVKNGGYAENPLRDNSRNGFGPEIEQANGSDLRFASSKLSSASSPPMWSRADDKSSWFANEHSRNGRMTGSEAVSSKGFSSVSVAVQNVHAMGRLPPVDGPSEGQRMSALSMLAAASKIASPQPTPRSIPSSENFSVPYGNGASVVSDDVFRPE